MIARTDQRRRVRLFLDSGVIIEGCFAPWGAAKAVLILATLRERFTVVLAEAIEREVQRAIANKIIGMDPAAAEVIARGVAGWIGRVRIERHPFPLEQEIRSRLPTVLPALRHVNDLPGIVTAMQANPDWVISSNTDHWSEILGARTGLRIVTPVGFLQRLQVYER